MDIHSNGKGAAKVLSNFSRLPFMFRGNEIASMEALLQSLKMQSLSAKNDIWTKDSKDAKISGQKYKWQTKQTLYWLGREMPRNSLAYQRFLNEAYLSLFLTNKKFRQTLLRLSEREKDSLTHKIGKNNISITVLTESEFISRLKWLWELKLTDNECESIFSTHSLFCKILTEVPGNLTRGKANPKRSS